MAPSSDSHLDLTVNMGTASRGSPMIALILIPPTMSRVVSNAASTVICKELTLECHRTLISVSAPKSLER